MRLLRVAQGTSGTLDTVIPKAPYKERRISGLVHESRVSRTLYLVQGARKTGVARLP